MRHSSIILAITCLFLLICVPIKADELPANSPLVRAIDAVIEQQHISADVPGLALCVIQPGHWTFKKGYGLANIAQQIPITQHTLLEIASVSKTFTATAILTLHERGKLSIHDDIRKFIPELPDYRPGHPIHIADLLHHVSGIPSYLSFENVPSANQDFWINADYVKAFGTQLQEHPLDFQTGQKYEYNNTNYLLLAVIVERVSRQFFGAFMREHIFHPAGMKNTFVYERPDAVPKGLPKNCHCAIGYEKGKKNTWRETWGTRPDRQETMLTVGDGAIWTNLEDMAHWDAALRHHKLLKPETMQLALTPSKTRDDKTNNYGLGWSIYPGENGKLNGFGHDGSWGGFNTSYYRYVAANRTTIVLSNRGGFDTDKFWYALNNAIEKHSPENKK
ncbi:MAG: pbpE 1 [Planctomycetaceae bacterium]|nr:pbpE 1 [Planctomycetaceae bacterium]